jgi:hypothetical protein
MTKQTKPAELVVVAFVVTPLSPRHRQPIRLMRPGAFDYRDIPSRCANITLPFNSSIRLENEKE